MNREATPLPLPSEKQAKALIENGNEELESLFFKKCCF